MALDQTAGRADWGLVDFVTAPFQKHSYGFRLAAVVAVFFWLLGQTLCLQHCARQAFAKGTHACCARKAAQPDKAPAGGGTMLCGSLKLAKLETKTSLSEVATLPPPSFNPVVLFVLPEAAIELGGPFSRRARPRVDWVFLPEVSLGAALRSLAPPALA